MKKLLYLLPVLILLTACEKKYKYVEIVKEQSFLNGTSIKEKNEDIISAPSDSAAYIDAFTSFCISQKVYYDMKKKDGEIMWIFLLALNSIIQKEWIFLI